MTFFYKHKSMYALNNFLFKNHWARIQLYIEPTRYKAAWSWAGASSWIPSAAQLPLSVFTESTLSVSKKKKILSQLYQGSVCIISKFVMIAYVIVRIR